MMLLEYWSFGDTIILTFTKSVFFYERERVKQSSIHTFQPTRNTLFM